MTLYFVLFKQLFFHFISKIRRQIIDYAFQSIHQNYKKALGERLSK